MNVQLARICVISLFASSVAVMPAAAFPRAELAAQERAVLQANSDAGLGSLRGGRVSGPVALAAQDRALLAAAESKSAPLGEMRGGALNNQQLTWIIVGAAIIVLIVILA